MALTINDACTACDACPSVCPNEAITVGNPIYVIDPLKCTECVGGHDEPQCKLVCPADCIVQHPDFVETPEQLAFLEAHGCEEYQGYYFARPLSASDAEKLLRTNLTDLAPKKAAAHGEAGGTRNAPQQQAAEAAGRRPATPAPNRIGEAPSRGAYHAEHADLRNFFRTVAEINWLLIILVLLYHSYLGVQVVIEDYVHGRANRAGLWLSALLHLSCAVVAIVSILRIAAGMT